MATIEGLIAKAHEVMDRAIEQHQPIAVFGLFSGGHDSASATGIASLHPAFTRAAHCNTGTGIARTLQYVRETSEARRWNLLELFPPDKSYEDFIQEYGLPVPAAHRYCYVWLKERTLQGLVQMTKHRHVVESLGAIPEDGRAAKRYQKEYNALSRKLRVMFVTGVRKSESKRRTRHVRQIQRNGATVWVAPIWDWTNKDKDEFMQSQGIPRNPVVDQLCMSGECRCGSFANALERKEQELLFPDDFKDILRWEKLAQDAGFPWGWGEGGPPDWWLKMQKGQLSFDSIGGGSQMLCYSCNLKQAV